MNGDDKPPELPAEVYVSYVPTPPIPGAFGLMTTDDWRNHARMGREVLVGRYQLVEMKTLTLKPELK